jgi:hypothetical protein
VVGSAVRNNKTIEIQFLRFKENEFLRRGSPLRFQQSLVAESHHTKLWSKFKMFLFILFSMLIIGGKLVLTRSTKLSILEINRTILHILYHKANIPDFYFFDESKKCVKMIT